MMVSFATTRSPASSSTLRIKGQIDGDFQRAPREARVGAMAFHDGSGRASVQYGAAQVIDAAGRRAPVETSFDGRSITLRVDADWLATARYPVIVDPLISRGNLAHGGARVQSVELYRDDQETDRNLWIVYSEFAAVDDVDLRIVRVSEEHPSVGSTVVFADLSSTWSTRDGRLAGIGGPGKVLTAFVRSFPTTVNGLPQERLALRWHSHDKDDLSIGTLFGSVTQGIGDHHWRPAVGGSTPFGVGRFALLAFQRERGTQAFHDTADSDVLAVVVDLAASERGVAGPLLPLGAGVDEDEEQPSINLEAQDGAAPRWLVAWDRRSGPADDQDVVVAAVDGDGSISSSVVTTADAEDATTDKHEAVISGSDGRYLLGYRQTDRNGSRDRLRVQRIDWEDGASIGQRVHTAVTLDTALDATFQIGGCAFDTNSRSHWAITYTRRAASGNDVLLGLDHLGFRGRRLDSFGVYRTNATATFRARGNVVFDDDRDRYPLVFATREAGVESIRVQRLDTPSVAQPQRYGSSCSTVSVDWLGSQRIGSDLGSLRIRGGSIPDAAVFLLGTQPTDQSLAAFGMPGCRLLVDLAPGHLIGGFAATGSGGVVLLPIPLNEDCPGLSLQVQAFYLDGGRMLSTRGTAIDLVR